MGHTLKKLRVDKIAILTEANPATGIPLVILKSNEADEDKDLAEIKAAVADFLGEDFNIEKAIDKNEFLKVIAVLKEYQPAFPDDIGEAVSALVSDRAKTFSEDVDEDEDLSKVQVLDEEDPWANLPFAVPGHLIKKSDELEKPEPEEDPDEDELDHDPVIGPLRRIEKRLAGNDEDEPKDLWPSLDPITPGTKIPIKKALPMRKVDPDEKQKGVKKGLGLDEGNDEIIKKVDEDPYPSIPDSLFERS